MGKLTLTTRRNLFFLLFMVSILVSLIVFAAFMVAGTGEAADSIHLDGHWTVTIHGAVYQDVQLSEFVFKPVGLGDHITMRNTLPEFGGEYPVLRIDPWYSLVDVFVDERPVFSYGHEEYRRGLNPGTGYHSISLDPYVAGAPVRIELEVVEPSAFTKLQVVHVEKANATILALWKERAFSFASSFFFIMVGLGIAVLGVVGVAQRRANKNLALMGVASFFLGLASFYDNDCAVLLCGNYPLNTWMNHVAIYGIAISLMLVVDKMMASQPWHKLAIKCCLYSFLVYAAVALFLDAHHIIHLVATRSLLMTLMGLAIAVAIVISVDNLVTHEQRFRSPSLGFLVMLAFIGADLLRYYVIRMLKGPANMWSGTLVCLGGMAFMICVFEGFYREFSESVRKAAHQEVFSRYMETDYDTGVYSGGSFSSVMHQLRSGGMTTYAQVRLVVHLEKYKGKVSPAVLENMMWAFAQAVQNSFGSKVIVFRTGFSEFTVIVPGGTEETVVFSVSRLSVEAARARQSAMDEDFVYDSDIQFITPHKQISE